MQSSAMIKKANRNAYLDAGDIKLGEEGDKYSKKHCLSPCATTQTLPTMEDWLREAPFTRTEQGGEAPIRLVIGVPSKPAEPSTADFSVLSNLWLPCYELCHNTR